MPDAHKAAVSGSPRVLVFLDIDDWRWRCETCGERSQAFTRKFVAALDAGNHACTRHAAGGNLR